MPLPPLRRLLLAATIMAQPAVAAPASTPAPAIEPAPVQGEDVRTDGSVTVGGTPIPYQAIAGTLLVHPKDWDDSTETLAGGEPSHEKTSQSGDTNKKESAAAHVFFVAYMKKGVAADARPITFIYNGGPGSSTIWLHMGAFGPRRVVTGDDHYTPAPPYGLENNAESLLDVSDLVFIDAPGTGFGRITGPDKEKAFWGFDEDSEAFANFIVSFLSRYGRWNSPKYLFGESYGTTRSAMLANILEQEKAVGLNGVILLSQILDFNNAADNPNDLTGDARPFVLALPTMAATAWYHHRLPGAPPALDALLTEVEHFADTDYLLALQQGATLPRAQRDAIAETLHRYTGLSVDYIKRADLRVRTDEFEHELLNDNDETTGRLDSRFNGPSMDPLDKTSAYDPVDPAVDAAFVAALNDYVRRTLHYGEGKTYQVEIDTFKSWNFKHKEPNEDVAWGNTPNVMPDLAAAMKYNPNLHVQLNGGLFDLGTPFYEGIYEMRHLPMPARLQGNIEFHQYASGHMVYLHVDALKQLHDNVAGFIRRTDNLAAAAHTP